MRWVRGFFRTWLMVSAIWTAFAVYLAFVGLAGYMYSIGPWVLWYARKYHVPHDKVYIDPEPKDCDFDRTPAGFKDCHYEPFVAVRYAEYPEGKLPAFERDLSLSVFVSWIKKSD